ncbi:DUF3631 domain-containing protein [Rhodococcus sp. T2V]|uniref:DUF3631 domain-containing protein n=1 Tax=Rhodococcus sp. T2V TaxID=3034164 RepID=UPI0023E2927A|nr:DUF3631 domain-containing protein [Rhodococcus sp. T2V]MDF3309888.1 DUF3631 domain-containing protein [Rhodococcus sp. T2V]
MSGAEVLDDIEGWFGRFIAVPDDRDLSLLALWTVSTHVALETYTTPRLLIDSTMPGSGKTTVLDHLQRLCCASVQAASLSSPALLVRLLQNGVRTVLIDEVDRSLSPNKPGVEDLIGILNSGYRRGATRPVLVPAKGGNWEVREMPTFCPVAMAGNSPRLPDDTRSRSIRVLLMPDLDGVIEDSDWELLEDDAAVLAARISSFADGVRDEIKGMTVDLPAGCMGRAKEKWRPLKRVAVAAGGHWPAIADDLISRNLAEDASERDAGLLTLPPGMVLLTDLHAVWPQGEDFAPSQDLIVKLIRHNPEYWGERSSYGKELTPHRMAKLVAQASKVTTVRPGGRGSRGYSRSILAPVWHRLGIGRNRSGASGTTGESGARDPQMHHSDQLHHFEEDTHESGSTSGVRTTRAEQIAARLNAAAEPGIDSPHPTVRTPGRQPGQWLGSGTTIGGDAA